MLPIYLQEGTKYKRGKFPQVHKKWDLITITKKAKHNMSTLRAFGGKAYDVDADYTGTVLPLLLKFNFCR